jgi:tRNA nucleotidyltransferase (CCA-adding enzyme)
MNSKNMENIAILSPETWPFSLEWLPHDAYLVGGAVRNALLQQQGKIQSAALGYLDLDFVLPGQAVSVASKIAKEYKAGFVVLDEKRKIARVVFQNATVDFAKQEGSTLITDLGRRDYTMNAIAYHPRTGEFVDPFNGEADIKSGIIRMVSPTNLADDPLRLLRAYRQAAQLGFTIDPETQKAIRQLAPFLKQVAAERIRTELNYILDSPQGANPLTTAWEDGLLGMWFPNATRESFAVVESIDAAAIKLAETWPDLGRQLSTSLSETLRISSYLGVAKLASLVSPEPKQAESQLVRLKFSRAEISAVLRVVQGWQRYQTIEPQKGEKRKEEREKRKENISLFPISSEMVRSQYSFFQEVKEMFPALAVRIIAAKIEGTEETGFLNQLIEKYLNPENQIAHPTPLVTGQQLMTALEISSSPQIGQLLTEIALTRAEGKISTPEEAIAFAKEKVNYFI